MANYGRQSTLKQQFIIKNKFYEEKYIEAKIKISFRILLFRYLTEYFLIVTYEIPQTSIRLNVNFCLRYYVFFLVEIFFSCTYMS